MKKWKSDGEIVESVYAGTRKKSGRQVMQIENAPDDDQEIILKIRLPVEYYTTMVHYTNYKNWGNIYDHILSTLIKSYRYYKKYVTHD